MEEIIQSTNTKLDRYKDLILKRDSLIKEAFEYEAKYIMEFGDLITECFEQKVKCIEKKKIINYCQKLINKGLKPNQADVDTIIEETMKEYYRQLDEMLKQNSELKKSKSISEYTLKQIKRIYYSIAKLIHPDMNPSLKSDETIIDLWQRATLHYKLNNLTGIEEVEVLVNKYLESINYEGNKIDIPNLDEKIFELNDEINKITNTDPYEYKYLLNNDEEVQEKKNDLYKEIDDYKRYALDLDKVIAKLNIERTIN